MKGARVYVTGRRQAELNEAVREIGRGAKALQGDIARTADLDRIYSQLTTAEGHLDILFANAGRGEFAPLPLVTEAQFEKYVGINFKGALFTVQKALPLMRPGSAIVITGSSSAVEGTPAFGIYAATKAALRSLTRTWASDLKGRDIRVNIVVPGAVVTPAYKSELKLSDAQIEQYKARMAEATPLDQVGQPALNYSSTVERRKSDGGNTMSQDKNIAIAQRLLAGIGEAHSPDTLATLFAEDLRFEIQGDEAVLPWIGHKTGRQAAADFFREIRVLTEPVKFEVEDILGGPNRAVIVGNLATKIKSSGKVTSSQFAIILTISGEKIARFQMLEDSFDLSRAVHG
jgi:NAD(P)-dependent dehydrogenase (short-subunit alcohol dehydrogenase family)